MLGGLGEAGAVSVQFHNYGDTSADKALPCDGTDEDIKNYSRSSRIGTAVPPAQHRAYGNEHDPEQNTGHSAVAVLGGHACEVAWDERWQRTCRDN